jgi:small subunit ribosomal protein S6
MSDTRIRSYEAMFLMGNQHTSDVEASLKLCKALVEKHKGEILVAKKWDERKLTYEMGKTKRGLYIIIYFKAPRAEVAAFERDIKLSEDYLRVLVTTADHLTLEEMQAVEPQPVQQPSPERSWDAPPMGFDSGVPGGDSRGPRGPRGPRREAAGTAAEAELGKE